MSSFGNSNPHESDNKARESDPNSPASRAQQSSDPRAREPYEMEDESAEMDVFFDQLSSVDDFLPASEISLKENQPPKSLPSFHPPAPDAPRLQVPQRASAPFLTALAPQRVLRWGLLVVLLVGGGIGGYMALFPNKDNAWNEVRWQSSSTVNSWSDSGSPNAAPGAPQQMPPIQNETLESAPKSTGVVQAEAPTSSAAASPNPAETSASSSAAVTGTTASSAPTLRPPSTSAPKSKAGSGSPATSERVLAAPPSSGFRPPALPGSPTLAQQDFGIQIASCRYNSCVRNHLAILKGAGLEGRVNEQSSPTALRAVLGGRYVNRGEAQQALDSLRAQDARFQNAFIVRR